MILMIIIQIDRAIQERNVKLAKAGLGVWLKDALLCFSLLGNPVRKSTIFDIIIVVISICITNAIIIEVNLILSLLS